MQERIFAPLEMHDSHMSQPTSGEVTLCYHETLERRLIETVPLASEVTAPSGGAIWSTVENMARWAMFNLAGKTEGGAPILSPKGLEALHTPQMVAGGEATSPSPLSSYALGWFVDSYGGSTRISHSGYLHNVSSDVSLFPKHGIALVSMINFGDPLPARVLNQQVLDLLLDRPSSPTTAEVLAAYETDVAARGDAVLERRICVGVDLPAADYAGDYVHPAYGSLCVSARGKLLDLAFHELDEVLERLHADVWTVQLSNRHFIHKPHPFDRASRFAFERSPDGEIVALTIPLEPAVAPIRFEKMIP